MRAGDPDELLVEDPVSNVPVTRAKMAAMGTLQWLNDELMNIYISLLLQRDVRRRLEVRAAAQHSAVPREGYSPPARTRAGLRCL